MAEKALTRRGFVKRATGSALGAMIVPRHVLGGSGSPAPSDRLNIAVVGAGGQGASDTVELAGAGENIVALADVDFDYVDQTVARRVQGRGGTPSAAYAQLQEAYSRAKRYSDFRRMLEQEKGIDAVLVATPDHTHAVVAKAAMELGKHVYVEKPLTYTVHEARVLRETAARTGVVTQMGNQGHSTSDARRINEWIQAGVIGPVHQVYVWTNRPIWPQGVPRPAPGVSVPDGERWTQKRISAQLAAAMWNHPDPPSSLNWDLFLGPAPEVAYHPIYHPFNWRGWVDWGTGALGDMGAHLIDHPYWALELTYPTSVEATSTPFGLDPEGNPASYPLATQVVYRFPERGSQPPVTLIWNDGGLMPPRPEALPDDVPLDRGGGVIFVGEKGILMHETYGRNPRLFPEALHQVAARVPERYPRLEKEGEEQVRHRVIWAQAAKGQGKASCPFDYAGPLTEVMLLGNVALRTGQGQRIYYDGKMGRVTSPAEANQYLHRQARQGWSL